MSYSERVGPFTFVLALAGVAVFAAGWYTLRSSAGMWDAVLRTGRHYRAEAELEEYSRRLLALFGLEQHATNTARPTLPRGAASLATCATRALAPG